MDFWATLISKNSRIQRRIYLIFFGFGFAISTYHRYHYSSEGVFHFSLSELVQLVLIGLVAINMRYIKFFISLFLLFAVFQLIRYGFFMPARSGCPPFLLFKELFVRFMDCSLIGFLHIILYSSLLLFLLFKPKMNNPNLQVLDQD